MEMADVDSLLGIFSDPEAMRYYPGVKDREETVAWVRSNQDRYRKYGFGLWAVVLKEKREFAGQCGPTVQNVEDQEEIEIGYLFLRKFWGRRLATEAARACRDYCLGYLGHTCLVSLIDPKNLASRRVAEKVGMTLEKRIEKWNKTICVYSLDGHCASR
jgi:RimJ/RimL family protein N-acetyltransferase